MLSIGWSRSHESHLGDVIAEARASALAALRVGQLEGAGRPWTRARIQASTSLLAASITPL
jgi:hypothetical protein